MSDNRRVKFLAKIPQGQHQWLKVTAAQRFMNMNDLLIAALEAQQARQFSGSPGLGTVQPDEVPDEIVNAAILATARAAMGGDGIRILAAAILSEAKGQIAAAVEAVADNYPEDVFPPDGTSRDAVGGTAMRHAYRNAARLIREEWPA